MDAKSFSKPHTNSTVFTCFSSNIPAGEGTFAAKNISKGTRIFTDKLLFNVQDHQNRELILVRYLNLSTRGKKIFDQLEPENGDVTAKFQTNALAYRNARIMCGIFPQAAGINHSCQPNVYLSWNQKIGLGTTHAICDIPAGREILISYCDPVLSYHDRKSLLARYSFECVCDTCEGFDPDSECRRAEIRRLKSGISRTRRHCPVILLDLIMVTDLIEEEKGLVSLDLADHYQHAAECCRATGQHAEALRFGRKTLEVVETCIGSDSGFFDGIKRFVEELEKTDRGG